MQKTTGKQSELGKKVLVLLYNRFTNDSRVLKTCTSLVNAGYQVELWASYGANLPEHEVINGFIVRRIFGKPVPARTSATPMPLTGTAPRSRRALARAGSGIPDALATAGRLARHSLRISAKLLQRVAPGFHDRLKQRYIVVERALVRAAKPARRAARRTLSTVKRQTDQILDAGAYADFDYIHCNDLSPLPLATAMKARAPGLKLIYDSHEYQTESAGLIGKPEKKLQFEKMERDNILFADSVITVGVSIAEEYRRLYGLERVHVVRNCPPLTPDQIENEYFREKYRLSEDDMIFLYQGGLMKNVRGLEETLNCFIRLNKAGFSRHFIVFMGYGNMEDEIRSAAQTYSNILFHPSIPPDRIPEVSSSADYGTIFIPNNCLSYFHSLPNKLFEYIVCGLPIVTTPLYDIRNLIEEEGIGYATSDFSEDAIYETLTRIDARPSRQLRARIRALHRDKYHWGIEERALLEAYRDT